MDRLASLSAVEKKAHKAEGELQSTACPSEGATLPVCADSDAEDSGKETNYTKTSSCKSNSKKGPARRAKQLERLQKKLQSQGLDFKYGSVEEYRDAGAKKAGAASSAHYEEMVTEAQAAPSLTLDERMSLWFKAKQEAFALPNVESGTVPDDLLRSGMVCSACQKGWVDGHLTSAEHHRRMSIVASLNQMLGPVRCRKLHEGITLKKGEVLTQKTVKSFWGPEVEFLPERAMQVLKKKQVVEVKVSAKRHQPVPFSSVSGAALALVPYNGSGVYSSQNSTYVRWECMPLGEDPDWMDEEDVAEFQIQQSDPNSQMWWPVVTWTLNGPLVASLPGDWASCIYQLVDSGELVAWPIVPGNWMLQMDEL
jgi:hypothetical protein